MNRAGRRCFLRPCARAEADICSRSCSESFQFCTTEGPDICHPSKLADSPPWQVDEFELDPVGVGEEDSVIGGSVGGIVGWGIEHRGTDFDQQPMQIVDVDAAVGVPSDVMQAGGVAIMRAHEARAFGLHEPY